MTNDGLVGKACSAINGQVRSVLASDSFKNWIRNEECQPGDTIVFNNSFLFREGIKTTKHSKYLCVKMGASLPEPSALVCYPGAMNSKFKRFVNREDNEIRVENLASNVAIESDQIGAIICALTGRIGPDEPATISLEKVRGFSSLSYVPTLKDTCRIERGVLSINRIDDVDAAWQAITATAKGSGVEIPDKLAEDFEKRFSELREQAYRPIDITDLSDDAATMLGEIAGNIEDQVVDYTRVLEAHLSNGQGDALNEMLRISYNFADGLQALASLLIGISDMKPVLFWLTIGDQFELADRFAALPFSLVGKAKPSIGRYRSVIAGARNHAFHDIFSFGRPFRIRLTGDAFQAPELRLFREHLSRRDPALEFADRQLVELLESFTRAPEQPVPRGFWEANRAVMQAVANVVRSLQTGLLLVAG